MLSRTAEALFWIGRYLERVQDLARVVDTAYHSRLERPAVERRGADDWEPLLIISGRRDRYYEQHRTASGSSVSRFVLYGEDNDNSVLISLRNARESARGMRDRISSEMWETLNGFHLWLRDQCDPDRAQRENLHELCEEIKVRCFLFSGVAQGTMVHDEGWNFLRAGTFLERASLTALVLGVQFPRLLHDPQTGAPSDVHQWMWLLRSVSAYEAYSKLHHLGVRPELVADYLVFDRTFPRSIRYSIGATESALRRISDSPAGQYANDAERILGLLHATLTFADRTRFDENGFYALLREVQSRCAETSEALSEGYFAYRVPGASLNV